MTFFWNFGDASSSISTNANHSYASADTFDVILYAQSDQICRDSNTQPVYVESMPVVNFSINDSSQCFNGNNFLFTRADTNQLGLLKRLWKFGDGDTSVLDNPTHSYLTPGIYDVTLISTSDFFMH